MDLESSNLDLARPRFEGLQVKWPKSARITLPMVGDVTTVCLHSISWYGARADMSGIDIPQMIEDHKLIHVWNDPTYVPGSRP